MELSRRSLPGRCVELRLGDNNHVAVITQSARSSALSTYIRGMKKKNEHCSPSSPTVDFMAKRERPRVETAEQSKGEDGRDRGK